MFFSKAHLIQVAAVSVALSYGVAAIPSPGNGTGDVQQRDVQVRGFHSWIKEDFHSGIVTFANGTTIDYGGISKGSTAPVHARTLETRAEVVTCYNFGTQLADQVINDALVDWCTNHIEGTFVSSGATVMTRYSEPGGFSVLLSATAKEGCSFTIDDNCTRLLQEPLNQCNVNANDKQGGFETDPCGIWRTDPGTYGINGSDQ